MSRRRKGNPVNGIVLLDKPAGLSSNQALQKVRRAFNARKAGHTGTLDPFATGMLPICLGEASKTAGPSCWMPIKDLRRHRQFLGESTTTGDIEGEVSGGLPRFRIWTTAAHRRGTGGWFSRRHRTGPARCTPRLKHEGQADFTKSPAKAAKSQRPAPPDPYSFDLSVTVLGTSGDLEFEDSLLQRHLRANPGRRHCSVRLGSLRPPESPAPHRTSSPSPRRWDASPSKTMESACREVRPAWTTALLPPDAGLAHWPKIEPGGVTSATRFTNGNPVSRPEHGNPALGPGIWPKGPDFSGWGRFFRTSR